MIYEETDISQLTDEVSLFHSEYDYDIVSKISEYIDEMGENYLYQSISSFVADFPVYNTRDFLQEFCGEDLEADLEENCNEYVLENPEIKEQINNLGIYEIFERLNIKILWKMCEPYLSKDYIIVSLDKVIVCNYKFGFYDEIII